LPVPRALVTPTAGALGAEHSLPRMSVASGSVDRPLALWDTSEVCKWAEEQLQLPPEVVDILREEEVNGLVASTLTETDMSRIGISKFGWRRRLFLGIADMIRSAICPQIHLLPGDGPMDQRLLVSPPSIAVAESSRAAASARTVDSDLHPLSLQRTSHVVQPASAGETVLPQAEDSRLGGSILSSHGSGRPHEGQSSPSVGLGTAGGGDTAMAEDVVGDGQRSEVAAMPSAEEKPGREEKEGKDGKEEEKTKEEKEEEEEREVKEEKEDEEGAAQPAPEHKNTHDSDLEAMLYGFCDPFELSAMGKQTSKERPAETKLAENTAAADALLYDLCDPFALAEEAQNTKAKRRRNLTADSEASEAARKAEADSAEAAFWDCYNPFEAEAEAQNARDRRNRGASSGSRRAELAMTATNSAQSAVSEYWQDITALKAKQRKNSQIELALCSRRHIGRYSEDSEEPPSMQPRLAAALLDAGTTSLRPRGGGKAERAAEALQEGLEKVELGEEAEEEEQATPEEGSTTGPERKEEQETPEESTASPLTHEALQRHNTLLRAKPGESSCGAVD